MSDYDEKLIKSLDECGCCRSLDARDRIRELSELLDECETLISAMRQEIQNLGGSLEGLITADATLAKLRGERG